MFYDVLFKIVQFTNDIVHTVDHVLFNMIIFITAEKCSIICQRKIKIKKVHSFVLITKKKKENHSFIHSFILTLATKAV